MRKSNYILSIPLLFSLNFCLAEEPSCQEEPTSYLESQKKSPQLFEQGQALPNAHYQAGYSAPARVDVTGGWDTYATLSYNYWIPYLDNLELGVAADLSNATFGIDAQHNWVPMQFEYKSGFQIGLGTNLGIDNWRLGTDYTWFRGDFNTAFNGNSDHPIFPTRAFSRLTGPFSFEKANQNWQLHMDLLDLGLSRSYYSGKNLTFRPTLGLRAAWIRQKLASIYTQEAFDFEATMKANSNSWGLGPRAGLSADWLLGYGLKLLGSTNLDLLFTRYTKISMNPSSVGNNIQFAYPMLERNFDTLRTHIDLDLGLGWGTYLSNNKYFLDLSASYGFQAFYDQNMFRNFFSTGGVLQDEPIFLNAVDGNLYIHGLTLKARFDF